MIENTKALIEIDVDSTNIKCCIYSSKTEFLSQAFRSTRNAYITLETPHSIVEAFAGELLWKLICEVCQEASNFLNQNHRYILKGISSTCIGGPTVCVDKDNKPVFPIRISSFPVPDLYHEYTETLGKDGYFKITGCIFDPLNSTFIYTG